MSNITETSEAPLETPSGENSGEASASAPRKQDYLEGFTAEKPDKEKLKAEIIETLRDIYDPEIPVNIYDLGLVYDIEIGDDNHVIIKMTLTTPNCPVAGSMPAEIELRVGQIKGVGAVEVELVWDPPWGMDRISDEAKLELGLL
ncbi:MAG: SUF system Fe-S cluster assembly protein [Zymomonas mobilis]|uniref:SUF system Fe-S cluster assembly protein n=1 Tax=Zymomonas mobilis TaxID=542 RepID=UPI0039E8CCE4